MSAWGLHRWSRTNDLSDLKYLFELHVGFYFNCDFYTRQSYIEDMLIFSTTTY
jgi:hypothetical protein